MSLVIIIILGLFLTYLIVKDANENRKIKKNINKGWKATPYINLRISCFENRIDLEKMRLKELIKNTIILMDKNAKIIDNNNDGFYIKSKNELIYLQFLCLEFLSIEEKPKEIKAYASLKNNEIINLNTYNIIKRILGKHIWSWEEEIIDSLVSKFYLKFSSGYIVMRVSKEDEMIFIEDKKNDFLKR
ncbi:hypothetical protein [Clostridium sp. LIBA-8841]|uniref:hypothetical protein n=1 Tax=Clostridium sp. LIBA-8841 TaxID=2987530 RepID=UPI002AC3E65D|nr:hypothetical protein [Clostridium sp. LIBA-8841]MDZ5252842.1 hypothetical protein [Clostridium sp. LIBA-8841]